jgi:ribonuclease HII
MLESIFNDENMFEIGIDEAGRGPLFGRLYVAAVILPKDKPFYHKDIKDSKKIKSRKKMTLLSEYIKTNALAYSIQYIEHSEIDSINIRQAVFKAAHQCIKSVYDTVEKMEEYDNLDEYPNIKHKYYIIMDGNDFIPYVDFDKTTNKMSTIPHDTIEGGDNKYMAIAAASILAKCERDTYIEELCKVHPELSQRYSLEKNMGYGTKRHLEGILEHGITQWHRRTYGRCKDAVYSPIIQE